MPLILASIIETYSEPIDIVIASRWAYTRSMAEIAELLPGGASRIVGSIWLSGYLDRSAATAMSRCHAIAASNGGWIVNASVRQTTG